jgi:hypothetical protein
MDALSTISPKRDRPPSKEHPLAASLFKPQNRSTQPRASKKRPKPHNSFSAHRSVYQEIPHRNRYHKSAS